MPSAASHGAVVFGYLQKHGPTPLWKIASALGISESQARVGIYHIKTVLGPIHSEPIIYKPYMTKLKSGWTQHTYELSPTAKLVKEYGAYRLGIHVKQLRNLGLIMQAGSEKFGDTDLSVLLHSITQAADTAEFVQKRLLGATP
jgi:hypothetical protein